MVDVSRIVPHRSFSPTLQRSPLPGPGAIVSYKPAAPRGIYSTRTTHFRQIRERHHPSGVGQEAKEVIDSGRQHVLLTELNQLDAAEYAPHLLSRFQP